MRPGFVQESKVPVKQFDQVILNYTFKVLIKYSVQNQNNQVFTPFRQNFNI